MANEVVKVKRDTIAACVTCPLCHKLFRDATTVSECLHTFCRKCIYKKLSDEETECCPICNIDLGCVPLEKLRPDHNLQDLRAKILPYKRQKVQAPEVVPSVTPPIRRKERSLSSLVVSTPRVSTQTGTTGRRSKSVARKALRGSTFPVEKPAKKEENSGEDQLDSSSSPETLNKFTQNIRQNSSSAELSGQPTPDNETENGTDQWEGKVDLWKPLNCLVEVANRSKSAKFTSQGSTAKSECLDSHDNEAHVRKTKVKKHGLKIKVHNDKNNSGPAQLESDKPKKIRRNRQKKASEFEGFSISPQTVLDAMATKCERRNNPIWFSLVASEDQEGDAPLPQISASYLRIKDGNIPVSFIQKYLMRKLDLMSEDEVEIRCMGQLILPTLQLNTLVDMWLETTSSEKVPAITGSSAKDFVMVLVYARKVLGHQAS
ncbi:E3 ubiquitin protein ligase DRIP2-like isoform X1 [Lycium ferocissimum]|uniref:E3 ubiquitin protein ligase DRIP2-like isoform X1 n=1 Tax=Lycium ferocissimum TaxID=112874 RepID=UPI0028157372|nr:E3 ubiquitin protein ligase DRIP2-like isoform X1 [Lycium ferocissimum]XP_059300869.1 E3 ubiquitin protein ligase DRIP2-like isoform X1 [Lycium ferocissimum]